MYYETDNHASKDEDSLRTIRNADESYNYIIKKYKNIDEEEFKSSYNFLEKNVPIYRIYRELYGSYFGKNFIKNNITFFMTI